MSVHGEMLTYGILKSDGHQYHIDDSRIQRGKTCNCVCPECGEDLLAKRGGHNKHHFAHVSGKDCRYAPMTALHLKAQELLERDRKVMLPIYEKNFVVKMAELKEFDKVILEQVYKDESSTRKPDCTCYKNGSKQTLWVEINCRHKVDSERKADIERIGAYCIEIDFKDLLGTDYSEQDIIDRLTKDIDHRRWINCPIWDAEEEREQRKEEERLREQQRIEEEEKRKELERKKAAQKHDAYLETLATTWRTIPDQSVVDAIIKEIKAAPYGHMDRSMYNHLVPYMWSVEYKNFPRNQYGLQVFYCLIHFYYNKIRLYDSNHSRWKLLDNPMWHLLKQKEHTDEENVLLEYMIVIWALNLLNAHKRFNDSDSVLAKKFANNTNIRRSLIEIMSRGRNKDYYLQDEVRESIQKEYETKEDGETIIQVFQVCFPIRTRPAFEQNLTNAINTERVLYGFDKELDEYKISEAEAWAELNRKFKEQEEQQINKEP